MFQRDTRSFWSNWQLLRRRMPLPVRAHGSSTYLAWSELSQHFGMSGQRRAGEVSTIIDHPSVFWFLVYFTCDLGNFGETTLVNPKLFSSSYFKFSILASLFLVQYHHQVSLKEEFLIQFNLYCLGISSYLLYIFVANLVVYTAFYITMKIIHGEKILVPTMVYAVLALGFWIPGWRPKFGTLTSSLQLQDYISSRTRPTVLRARLPSRGTTTRSATCSTSTTTTTSGTSSLLPGCSSASCCCSLWTRD